MRKWILMAAVVAMTGAALAEEWPKWLGPRGDNISRQAGLLTEWPADGPKELWSKPVGDGYASAIGHDGRVYLFHMVDKKEVLTAWKADTGEQVWSQTFDGGYSGGYPGTRATPTIEGAFIYTSGGAGDVICRNLADGEQVWHTGVLKETGNRSYKWGLSSAPTIVGDRIVVQAGLRGPAVVALNKADGKIVWKSEAQNGSYATVVAVDVGGKTQLVAPGERFVFGIDPDNGKTLWQEAWYTKHGISPTTPIYRDGHLFISSGYNHGCMMLKLSADGAEKLWEKKLPDSKFPAAVLDGDAVYIVSEKVGSVMCIEWPTGKVLWKCEDPKVRLGFGGSIVRFGEHLVAMSDRGTLSLLKATPEKVELVSQTDLFRGRNLWASPLLYRGRLYARGDDKLVCLDINADK